MRIGGIAESRATRSGGFVSAFFVKRHRRGESCFVRQAHTPYRPAHLLQSPPQVLANRRGGRIRRVLFAILLPRLQHQARALSRTARTAPYQLAFGQRLQRAVGLSPNQSLQRTFDPPPAFATAKPGAASNAAELRR